MIDRDNESHELLADIRSAGSSTVARVQSDSACEVAEDRPVGTAAGVTRDSVLSRLGSSHHRDWHEGKSVRLVVAEVAATRGGGVAVVHLLTDRLDWPAELVAVAYRYRWSVEPFFRWLKSIPGCRHLPSHPAEGIAIQVYRALIASVLSGSGVKPNKRLYEMVCHYLSGWATEAELLAYLDKAKAESSAWQLRGRTLLLTPPQGGREQEKAEETPICGFGEAASRLPRQRLELRLRQDRHA